MSSRSSLETARPESGAMLQPSCSGRFGCRGKERKTPNAEPQRRTSIHTGRVGHSAFGVSAVADRRYKALVNLGGNRLVRACGMKPSSAAAAMGPESDYQ